MNNNATFTNILVVIVLVLLVAFGVWYFTGRPAVPAAVPENNVLDVDIGGGVQPPEQGSLDPQ